MQRLNVIANNAANALTPGFKREFLAAAGQLDWQSALALVDNAGAAAPFPNRIITDNSPGAPRQTAGPLDLALLGEGFFEVQTPNGPAFTRQGSFHLDAQGRLVSQGGYPIAGIGGDIVLGSPNPTIDREGKIFEQGKQVGQIKVVTFDSASSSLVGIGGGLLAASQQQPQSLAHPRIAQGQLESSNVDSNREMVNLLETYRHFESASRVLQAYDDIRDKTFRSLGQF